MVSPGPKPAAYRAQEVSLMDDAIIEVHGFRKTYGTSVAVDGISFDVRRGEIFGLLGPNGAGKTSTLESLEGLRRADGGTLRIAGVDPGRLGRQLRALIGVQLQTSGLPDSFRVDEAMRFFCAYHGVAPRDDLIERVGLGEKRSAQYHELSGGQQRRLALALAVAHNPPVVFLDEPTAGLDVASRAMLHDLMRELQAGGTTILLATHDMAEASEMATRVAILLRGRIAALGTPLELTAAGAGLTKISVRTEENCLARPDATFPAVQQVQTRDDYHIYFSTDVGPTVSALIAYIDAQADPLVDLRVERPTLEDRFLEITTKGPDR
jgi:ABC-2 type transport system ATP-binding protein